MLLWGKAEEESRVVPGKGGSRWLGAGWAPKSPRSNVPNAPKGLGGVHNEGARHGRGPIVGNSPYPLDARKLCEQSQIRDWQPWPPWPWGLHCASRARNPSSRLPPVSAEVRQTRALHPRVALGLGTSAVVMQQVVGTVRVVLCGLLGVRAGSRAAARAPRCAGAVRPARSRQGALRPQRGARGACAGLCKSRGRGSTKNQCCAHSPGHTRSAASYALQTRRAGSHQSLRSQKI
jgi:hypothetical protein